MLTPSQIEETQSFLRSCTNEQLRTVLLENQKMGHKHGGAVARRAAVVAGLILAETKDRLLKKVETAR